MLHSTLRLSLAIALALVCTQGIAQEKKDPKKDKAPALKPINIAKVERTTLVDFEKDILPILERSCTACHSAALDENGLILETPQAILKGGKRGPAAIAGKGAESLMLVVAAHQKEPVMPPVDNDVEAKNLKPEELGLIKLWIDQGATGTVSGKSKSIVWQPLPAGVNPIFAVALSSDGQYVACSRANQIFVYHVPSGQLVTRLTDPQLNKDNKAGVAHLDLVQALTFNPEGDLLASGAFREVKLWRRPGSVRRFNLADAAATAVRAIATSPDGKWLATGGADNTVKLFNLADGKPAKNLAGHTAAVTGLAFSADGTKLYSASLDKSIRGWNVADGAAAGRIDTPAPIHAITLTNKGTQLATGGADNLIRVWNLPAGAPATLEIPGPASFVAVSPDRKVAAIATADGKIALVDVATRKVTKTLAGHSGGVTALAFSSTASRLASSGADNTIKIWDPAAEAPVATFPGSAVSIALNPAGNQVITGLADGRVQVWKVDAAAARVLTAAGGVQAPVQAVSKDGKLLATAGVVDGKPAVVVHDIASGNIAKTFLGHEGPITALAFNGEGTRVISGSADKTARVWNLADGKELSKIAGHNQTVTAVGLSGSGTSAVTGTADNQLKLWSVEAAAATEAKNLAGHAGPIVGAAIAGEVVVSASADKTLRTWNRGDGAQTRSIDVGQPATALSVSGDGAKAAVGAGDKTIRVFQLSDGKPLGTLTGHAEAIQTVSLSPDGARLVSADAKQAIAWDVAKSAQLEAFAGPGGSVVLAACGADPGIVLVAGADKALNAVPLRLERAVGDHAKKITGLALSADGQTLFTSSEDGTVRGYTLKDGQQKFNANHAAPVRALALSADGKSLATAGEDKQIKVWTSAGQPAAKPLLAGFSGPVTSVAFSPDNARVIGGSAANEALVFTLADGTAEQSVGEHAGAVQGVAWAGEKGDALITTAADKSVRVSGSLAAGKLAGHTGPVNALVGFGENQLLSGSEDGSVRHWNALTPQPVRQMAQGGPVTSVAVRPDGQRFASTGANSVIKLWNAQNGQPAGEIKGDIAAARKVARLDREVNLAKGIVKGHTDRLAAAEKDIPTKTEAAKKAGDAKMTADKAFAEKSDLLKKAEEAKAGIDKAVADANAEVQKALEAQKAADESTKKTKDAEKLAQDAVKVAKEAADKNKENADLVAKAKAAEEAVAKSAAEAKTATEAKANADKAVADAQKKAKEATDKVAGAAKPVDDAKKAAQDAESVKKAADKALVEAEAGVKRAQELIPTIKGEVAATEMTQKQFEGQLEAAKKAAAEEEKPVRSLAFSADNTQLVSGGDNNKVYTWSANDGAPIETFAGHTAPVLAVAFGPAGTLISGASDKSASVWELSPAWKLERTIGKLDADSSDPTSPIDRVLAIDFSPDGALLATGGGEPSRSGELKLWKVADGSLVGTFPDFKTPKTGEKQDAHSDTIFGVKFSPNGQQLATCGADKFVKLWNIADGKFVRSFEGHTHHVLGVSWQTGAKMLASCGADNVVKVWNVETGEQQRTIQGFSKQVTSIQFIGDTQEVLTACGDKTVRRNRANDGGNVRQYPGATDFVYAAATTPNGKLIVAGGHDSILRVWNGETSQEVSKFEPPK